MMFKIDNTPISPDDWEFQLDNMGVGAPIDVLEAHLACCPDRDMPAAAALLGYLEGRLGQIRN